MSVGDHLDMRRTVYVAHLDPQVTPEILTGAFVPFGDVAECVCGRGEGGPGEGFTITHSLT